MTVSSDFPSDPAQDRARLEGMIALALAAGAETMRLFAAGVAVRTKPDASPVTEADRAAEAIILSGLDRLAPDVPTLAEEAAADGGVPALGAAFFLVDPLDGTKEFISGSGEFTVNIALVRSGRPVLGVVYAPALDVLYAGGPDGAFKACVDRAGALGPREPVKARARPAGGLVAVASRSHRTPETDAFLATLDIADFTAAGSSLKFCRVAEGAADVYPRFGRTMEWDTGAGQAVLEAAGGRVVVAQTGAPLGYGKAARGFDNPHFIAWGA